MVCMIRENWQILAVPLLLAACGPQLAYTEIELPVAPTPDQTASTPAQPTNLKLHREVDNPYTPDPTGSIRFALEEAAITLLPNNPSAPAGTIAAAFTTTPPPKADSNSCPATGDWTKCFSKIATTPVVKPIFYGNKIYRAEPDDPLYGRLGRTTMNGTSFANESPYLLQTIAVKYTDNTKNIITGIGGGITTGFTMGGPEGAIIGGIGGAVSTFYNQKMKKLDISATPVVYPDWYTHFVCLSVRPQFNANGFTATLKPVLNLPIVINGAKSRPYAIHPSNAVEQLGPSDETGTNPPIGASANQIDQPGCWKPLPNTGTPTMGSIGKSASNEPRSPTAGDGWFYRIVIPANSAVTPKRTEDVIADLNTDQFPVSWCQRGAVLEITWWSELSKSVQAKGMNGAKFDLPDFPDASFAVPVPLPYSGNITFNSTCGAVVNVTAVPDYSATTQALNTVINNYITAEANRAKASTTK